MHIKHTNLTHKENPPWNFGLTDGPATAGLPEGALSPYLEFCFGNRFFGVSVLSLWREKTSPVGFAAAANVANMATCFLCDNNVLLLKIRLLLTMLVLPESDSLY